MSRCPLSRRICTYLALSVRLADAIGLPPVCGVPFAGDLRNHAARALLELNDSGRLAFAVLHALELESELVPRLPCARHMVLGRTIAAPYHGSATRVAQCAYLSNA